MLVVRLDMSIQIRLKQKVFFTFGTVQFHQVLVVSVCLESSFFACRKTAVTTFIDWKVAGIFTDEFALQRAIFGVGTLVILSFNLCLPKFVWQFTNSWFFVLSERLIVQNIIDSRNDVTGIEHFVTCLIHLYL